MVLEETLDSHLGFEYFDIKEDSARGSVPVTNRVRQPYGLVHGGVYAALAESLASIATAPAVWDDGNIAVGLSNATNFMRPATEGTVHAHATRRHTRPHDVGLGRRHDRRRGPPVRDDARDDGRAAAARS